jgi:uncharacterized protein (UPF0332 family)
MSESPQKDLVDYRLRQAYETIQEADALLSQSFLRGAINRAYYAMFYAVLALAVVKGLTTSKHSGVIAFLDREFIRTQILPKELSQSIHLAFQRRQESDYGDVFTVGQDEAVKMISEAKSFVNAISSYLKA